MSGIRDHKLVTIKYRFRMQMRESDGGGGTDFIGWDDKLSDHQWRGLFPSLDHARVYAHRRLQYLKDAELVDVIDEGQLDCVMLEHVW